MRLSSLVKKTAILCHRWMGVTFCLLFAWWFLSGIFMMYWDYPDVSLADRLDRAQRLDESKIKLSAADAWAKLGEKGPPGGVSLAMFDGRPIYRFASGSLVYADNGEKQDDCPEPMLLRLASAWTSQLASSAKREDIQQPDQWTIGVRESLPLVKYSFRDGQEVYISAATCEILQYTTTASRVEAYLGPIPHWLYFTPLRVHTELWSNLIIYASLVGTLMALLGLIVGVWIYSPSKRVPYAGPKRLHMILGLFFGIVTCTWAFSGMLSMDPPFLNSDPVGASLGSGGSPSARIQAALHPGPFHLADYVSKTPQQALAQLGERGAKELEFTSFDGRPVYLATLSSKEIVIVPVQGEILKEYNRERIFEMVALAAQPATVLEQRAMTSYDAYYLDRHHRRPLPVLFVKLNDAEHSQLYIDPRTARTVEQHSDIDSFTNRWLYHALHSWDYPWLYNHRPAWDIVVLTLMLGGLTLCVTSVIIGWQLLRRKLAG